MVEQYGALACGALQAHNPFLEQLQEEDEEEELELYVEELVLELVKGPGGYGMDITESGHVVGNTPGGVAEAAGAPRARARSIALGAARSSHASPPH